MNIWTLLPAFFLGGFLSLFYFGGLYWTVVRLSRASRPGLLLAVSAVLRLGIVLFAFYLILLGGMEGLFACVAGFILTRLVVVRHFKKSLELAGDVS